jgi:RhoGEF domain
VVTASTYTQRLEPEAERALVRVQARIRARQSRRVMDKALKREAHRDHVAREILSTEESYVHNLQKLMSLYLVPMLSMKHLGKETTTAVKTIAGNVGIIISYNQQLLNDLRVRVCSCVLWC